MNSSNTTKMVEHKLVLFATVIALWTLVTLLIELIRIHTMEIHTRPKLCHFGLECSYGKIFIPVTEISR